MSIPTRLHHNAYVTHDMEATRHFYEDLIGMPLTAICQEMYQDARQRQLFKNIMYVGALAALMDVELGVVEALIGEQYRGKDKLIDGNRNAARIGHAWACEHHTCPLGIRVERAVRAAAAAAAARSLRARSHA